MTDDCAEAEAKLQKLADRVHRGWAKLHPVTEKELEGVREAVREQWQREERVRRNLEEGRLAEEALRAEAAKRQASEQTEDERKRQDKDARDKDWGHSH